MNCILQWNMQSYRSNFRNLKLLIERLSPVCICLQETLIRDNIVFPPNKYNLIQSEVKRDDGHERGVAILVHKKIAYDEIPINSDLQVKAIKLYLNKHYTICSIYLPHIPVTLNEISNVINQLPRPFLLLGDVNAKSPLWGDCNDHTDRRGELFERLLLNHDICILNDGTATHYHIQTNSTSAIDLSICSSDISLDFLFSTLEDLNGSDHFPIVLSPSMNPNPVNFTKRLNFKKANWKLFHDITSTNMIINDHDNINDIVTMMEDMIMNAAYVAIPMKGNNDKIPVPWFNDDCKIAKRERLRAQRALRRNYNLMNKINFQRCRARCRYIFKQAQSQSWRTHLSKINQHTSLSKIWKIVSKISGKFQASPSPVLRLPCGNLISDSKTVANEMARSFSEVTYDRNYLPEFLQHKRSTESRNLIFNTARNFEYNEPFSMHELMSCLSLTGDTSPGIDRITYRMIKNMHPSMMEMVLKIFNLIFTKQEFPDRWKTAVVIPILKPGKDPRNTNSYRPISLTSCLGKLLEKIVNTRLMWFLETNNLINKAQSGFRRNRSTTDNLVALENHIQDAISNKYHTIAVLFDLKKAYDMAWRRGIMENLFSYGLRGNLPIYLQNFLSNRQIKVRVNEIMSDPFLLMEGVPQGSVLSCTLFLVAVNHIVDNLPRNVNSSVYVDDLVIYASGRTPQLIERRLQTAINSITNWTKHTGFRFSTEKTVSLHMCRRRNCPKMAHNLTLHGQPITAVTSYKYLGLIFDSSVTWKPHITSLRKSCIKTLNLLKYLTSKKWGADRVSLLRLFIMLIKPKLEYGIEAFSSASPTLMSSLEPIQNTAIRISTGAYRSSPLLSLYAESGMKPPTCYWDTKMLNFFTRLFVNVNHPLHDSAVDMQEFMPDDEIPNNASKGFMNRIMTIQRKYNLNFNSLMLEVPVPYPVWKLSLIDVCEELFCLKKSLLDAREMKAKFLEHLVMHNNSEHIFTDGSKSLDGVGYAYYSDNTQFTKRIQSQSSIFTAELLAIYDGLAYAERSEHYNITIFCDSRSALVALKKYLNPNPLIQKIQCRLYSSNKRINFCWVPSHVGVIANEAADVLARECIIRQNIETVDIPRSDHKSVIKHYTTHKWREKWTNTENNKYRNISATITPLPHSCCENRRWSIALTRLRIGHTNITHKHLMERNYEPYCEDCLVPLTVEHILAECPSFAEIRRRHFRDNEMSIERMLRGNLCAEYGSVYRFLTEIDIYNLL